MIVDTFSRFSLAIVPQLSFQAPDVLGVIEQVGREIGRPKTIRATKGATSTPAISTSWVRTSSCFTARTCQWKRGR